MKIVIARCAMCVLFAFTTWAQTPQVVVKPLTDTDIQLLRSDLSGDKKQIIADTMQFTEAESVAFWPVYRNYAHDQQVIGDDLVQVIKDFASNYDSLDDSHAKDMVQRLINIEDRTLNLREDYWPQFEKALGAKRAARFYQVDNRLTLMVKLQLASAIPLVP